MTELHRILGLPADEKRELLGRVSARLEKMTPQGRVSWALAELPARPMLSSSFGIQAAVMLHLVTRLEPDIPVVLTDTGYLFPETYRFADQLTERLGLALRVYTPVISPAWAQARYGKLWQEGKEGIREYNRIHKVEPMQRALRQLEIGTWFSGLRRSQSSTRADRPCVEISHGAVKVYPIIDWSDRDVDMYIEEHDLPYHPLREKGYVSVGDVHTSAPLESGMSEESTRFFGLARECGLHIYGDGI